MRRLSPRTRWYAIRLWPVPILGVGAILGAVTGAWTLVVSDLAFAVILVLAVHTSRTAYTWGYYSGQSAMVEAIMRADDPVEAVRLMDSTPNPWDRPIGRKFL